MQTLEQIVDNFASQLLSLQGQLDYWDYVDDEHMTKDYLDKLAKLREDTVSQIKQLIKEKSNV